MLVVEPDSPEPELWLQLESGFDFEINWQTLKQSPHQEFDFEQQSHFRQLMTSY